MKKNLFLLFGMLLLSIMTISAQNYVWNFGQDRILFPKGVQYINDTIVAGLTISSKAETNPMQIVQKYGREKSGVPSTYQYCLSPNGSGYNKSKDSDEAPRKMIPDKRYLSFKVNSNCIIKAHILAPYKGSSARLFITDGKKLIGTMIPIIESNDVFTECSVNYSHSNNNESTLYIYGNNTVRICYLEVKSDTSDK